MGLVDEDAPAGGMARATFMDTLADSGFIVAGGPPGGEDDAARVMHVVNAPREVKESAPHLIFIVRRPLFGIGWFARWLLV